MYKNVIFLLLIILLFPCELVGQTVITGKVIEQENGRSLPSANIVVKDSSYGTASNSEGLFSLTVDSLPVQLVVSYLGFQDQELTVNQKEKKDLVVSLEPLVVKSKGITVTDDYEVNLVEKAIGKLLSKKEHVFGKAFYRQLTQSDSVYSEFIETFYHAELSPNVIEHVKVENGRYAVIPYDSLESTIYHTNFSVFSRIELVDEHPYRSTVIWPLREDSRDYYNFYLEKKYRNGTEDALVIRFEPKENIKKPAFKGTVVITDSSYTILKLKARINEEGFNPINPHAKKTEVQNSILEIELSREPLSNEILYPNMIKVDLSYDYIKKKGLFGSIDFKRRVQAKSLLFFYNYEVDGLSQYLTESYFDDEKTDASDYRLIDKTDYQPEFWQNNPIIQRTPIENKVVESFEKYGFFGKMFNDKTGSEDS